MRIFSSTRLRKITGGHDILKNLYEAKMGVILTISFKVTAEIETYVLHRTSQTRCIGFVKHRMYVLSFIHCHEMRSVLVVFFFNNKKKRVIAPFYAARSSLTASAGGFSVEKALNKKLFALITLSALVV